MLLFICFGLAQFVGVAYLLQGHIPVAAFVAPLPDMITIQLVQGLPVLSPQVLLVGLAVALVVIITLVVVGLVLVVKHPIVEADLKLVVERCVEGNVLGQTVLGFSVGFGVLAPECHILLIK